VASRATLVQGGNETWLSICSFFTEAKEFMILAQNFGLSESRTALLSQIEWMSCCDKRVLQAFMEDGHPNVVAVVDAMEQRIQRPKHFQREWYSGKKKVHTINSQILIDPGHNSRQAHVRPFRCD